MSFTSSIVDRACLGVSHKALIWYSLSNSGTFWLKSHCGNAVNEYALLVYTFSSDVNEHGINSIIHRLTFRFCFGFASVFAFLLVGEPVIIARTSSIGKNSTFLTHLIIIVYGDSSVTRPSVLRLVTHIYKRQTCSRGKIEQGKSYL